MDPLKGDYDYIGNLSAPGRDFHFMGHHGRIRSVVGPGSEMSVSLSSSLDLQVSQGGFAGLFWLWDRRDEVQDTLSPPHSHLNSSRIPPTSQTKISTGCLKKENLCSGLSLGG